VEVICLDADGVEQRSEVLERERRQLAMESLGMSLADGKAILQGVQDFVTAQPVPVPHPRWHRCSCQTDGPKTFRPTAASLKGRTSPERLCLETKWCWQIRFEEVADLWKEVVPVGESTNHETIREHLQAIAERMEAELGEERPSDPFSTANAIRFHVFSHDAAIQAWAIVRNVMATHDSAIGADRYAIDWRFESLFESRCT
jgi:hypothetical protein